MKFKKIRGLKRKIANIQNWINEYLELNIEQLTEYKYEYVKVYVDPWDNLTMIDSEIPEPKGKAKKEIIKGLEKIYDSWRTELEKLNKPYYLKIWLYEPRISKSQVVCAIEEKIEYYENIFERADFKQNSSSFTTQLGSDFNWQPRVDEEPYEESELLWPLEQYQRIEDCYSDRRLLRKLKNGKYRNQEIVYPNENNDTAYFLPKGKIWLGQK
ncbi:hypothetical protein [Mangrovibacterium diazotrophicum]|uniref:Uncharacterized protein n=1 Tax=Mangrovibacterium diazotrophicum TaxID=1261403 RepID=A0A419VX38_9BACT|nr:hypothetical protein [Mangrovibacterium diazotrophicum]RKD87766.1 hypothetical protein BC643_3773 [Mangrovibacterium diazotrophicum]